MSLRLTAWRWHFIFVSTQDSFTAVRHLQLSAFSQSSSELPCVYFGRLGKPWNSVVRLFSSVFLRDLWYDSPHNIGCVADMHRSSLLSPSFLIIWSYLFDFPLLFFLMLLPLTSPTCSHSNINLASQSVNTCRSGERRLLFKLHFIYLEPIWHTVPLFYDSLECWMEKLDCIFCSSCPAEG